MTWYATKLSPVQSHHEGDWRRIGLLEDLNMTTWEPDTTAVILNWSRFPNVLQISSVLCSQPLSGIIAEVFIWNNSPKPITFDVRFVGVLNGLLKVCEHRHID